MKNFSISGNLIDIHQEKIYPATVTVEAGRIKAITPASGACDRYILPGFIDAHVHVESSMLIPSEFARLAVVHGTVATISDPHEIGNVLGVKGVDYMINNAAQVPFKFYFGAPSCVPATTFETAGAIIDPDEVDELLRRPEIHYLSEMMNFPGVLNEDEVVMQKIKAAQKYHKPVDGHAPGLRGEQAKQYAAVGISTDHECFTAEEAQDKLNFGMHILIREGSAARNFEALIGLLADHADKIMFCSDDKHPDSLELGHINDLVKRALAKGIDLFKILKAACVNPVEHYNLNVGLLREGDPADFIIIDNPEDFNIQQTFINGAVVAENGQTKINSVAADIINNFNCQPKKPSDFKVPQAGQHNIPIIVAQDGQLITEKTEDLPEVADGELKSSIAKDILKIAVINRYEEAPVAKAFIKNFGLQEGAIASTVAHDSHNIIAVGVDDDSICKAVNALIACKGGVCTVSASETEILPLPVAGLMTNEDGYKVAAQYQKLDKKAKAMGSRLGAPFMTLSFMALLVIPHLKLSDKGLFDGDQFDYVPGFMTE